MSVNIFSDQIEEIEESAQQDVINMVEGILDDEDQDGSVNIIFCNNELMQELNRRYRGFDKTTDVLSFEWNEEDFLGEIYISIPQVAKQAPKFESTFEEELLRVSIHGALHLCGYDHETEEEQEEMRSLEEEYLDRDLSLPWEGQY